ncbi:Adiponectin receptor protein 1 [Heterocephalus glaber]|uniref:Adiponectin receptor protein 1 n=1 Tax=Heterocephalus glaber TaxID=10181 RepID=G5B0I3_HETGA|nr:Adiponectin receptor protein 1 [Heterocephalus glaber]
MTTCHMATSPSGLASKASSTSIQKLATSGPIYLVLCFLFLGILTMLRPNMYFTAPLHEVVFRMFFLGTVLCLSFSWLFHTVYCHSVSRTFSKLDYSGIALLMGSFVPWLYYSLYCSPQPRLIYLSIVCVLGTSAITVAQWDRFATPKHRQTRAGVFLGLGLSGVVPIMHFTITEGFGKATTVGQMGWFFLMAVMYITGAGLCAAHIPERFFPGKYDIWFQSHQIFHVLVVAAAFVHFYGVSNLQEFHYGLQGGCTDDSLAEPSHSHGGGATSQVLLKTTSLLK